MKRILLSFVLALMALTGSAQLWNFKTVSDADVAVLDTDATNWYHETGSNNRYHYINALDNASLKAGDNELEYAKGLLFSVLAGTATNGKLRIDIKNSRLWVDGESKIVIPNVAAEKVVTIIAKSSKSGEARGVNVSENVKPVSGKFNDTSADQITNVGVVQTTGDVVLTFPGAMYVYEISVQDADNDGEGGSDTPEPSPAPTLSDNSTSANALKNQVVISTANFGQRYFNTEDVNGIEIDANNKITVKQSAGDYTYQDAVSEIKFRKASSGQQGNVENVDGKVNITEASGWFESAYVKFEPFTGAKTYNVYIKGGNYADYTKIDQQLVRNYGTYGRADVLGLVKGSDYAIKVVPISDAGTEMAANANEATAITVVNYDRSGFAHKGRTDGVGAYNNDGSLKAGAHVVYVTKDNAKTVSLDLATNSSGKTATYTGLQQIIYGYQKGDANGSYEKSPLCIRIIGTISAADCDEFLSSAEGIQIKGAKANQPMNITIEGVGDDATTYGFGFLIRSAASIELRNFANMLCMDDAVSIDTDNSNIWIHHLDLFYGKTGSDADQAKGDGTLDIKGDSKFVTFYANHLWDSGKASLCGMKSESGPNWVTYHHNWFDHSDSRHPRIRTMSVHVYNNYYDGNSKYGVGAAYQSNTFVENNYFRNCKYPMLISMQGSDVATNPKGTFSSEDGGMIKSFGNKIVGALRYTTYQQNKTEFDAYEATTRDEKVPADVKAKQGGRNYDNFDTDAALFYSYTPDTADDVPEIVTGWLGAGRMGHGDFQWQFNNATEDGNYNVIDGLKTALQNYKSTLVGIYGDENAQSGEQGQQGGGEQEGEQSGGEQGGKQGGEQTDPLPEGTIVATFDGSPSLSMFAVTGDTGDGKITYEDKYYKKGVKLNSKGSITFTPQKNYYMTIVLATTKTATDVSLNGTKTTVGGTTNTEGAYYEMEPIAVTANTQYAITKGTAESILMVIKLVPVE